MHITEKKKLVATFKKKFFFGFFIFTFTAVLMLDLGNDALQSLQSFEFEGTGIISDKWYFSKMDFDREMWRDPSNDLIARDTILLEL